MNLLNYRIENVLSYQTEELKRILGENTITFINKNEKPYFYDAYVGLTPTEVESLTNLGYVLVKNVLIGDTFI